MQMTISDFSATWNASRGWVFVITQNPPWMLIEASVAVMLDRDGTLEIARCSRSDCTDAAKQVDRTGKFHCLKHRVE